MERLNIVGLDSPFGYKTLELFEGDLTKLESPVDILVVSLVRGSYWPTPGSLVEALNATLDTTVEELRRKCQLDLTDQLDCWVSSGLSDPIALRVLGLEMEGHDMDISESLDNLFAGLTLLGVKGFPVETVAMPLIATGSQSIDPELVMSELLGKVRPFLTQSAHVHRILTVEINQQRAVLLSDGMNNVLKRPAVGLPHNQLIAGVRGAILETLDRAWTELPRRNRELVGDIRRTLRRDDPRSYEMGVAFRRMAESVTTAALPENQKGSLNRQIQDLRQAGYAKWIVTYLHVLRVFGNEAAHESAPSESQKPATVKDADLAVCLVCAHRVLEFWLDELN